MKRHTELAMRQSANVSDPIDRGYRIDDLNAIAMMAAAAGFNAVTVLALYVSSETVRQLYSHPWVLWFICPVMMYWLGRVLVLTHRQAMDEASIMFALKDKVSWLTLATLTALVFAAM
jgi:4-hydroxybenzoate polyprenyltransferase